MPATTFCSFSECGAKHYSKSYCRGHYEQARRGGQLRPLAPYTDETAICAADDCNNEFQQRAVGTQRRFCSRRCRDRIEKRTRRQNGWVPPHRRPDAKPCTVDGCEKPLIARGYCAMHLERIKKHGDPHGGRHNRPGEWRVTPDGYMRRHIGGRIELQHRVVMEERLGRPLWSDETVHHKNGDRSDNRPENLELWSSWQPAGQRVEDKIRWARELLARYRQEIMPDGNVLEDQ